MINKHYKEIKTALRKSPLPNGFNLGRYMFSPYAACEHGCVYCDGRAERYYIDGDFDRDIVVRKNLPELLSKELGSLKEPGFISIGSGVSDPYQPVEESEMLMKRCAEEIAEHNYPVTLLTKSPLVMRDIDIWKRVHEKTAFLLMVSLTFTDDSLRRKFEPRAGSVEERLEIIKAFKEAGMYVGILAMPFIPFISDTDDSIAGLFKKLKTLDVDFIMPGNLTLRPGRQKEFFMELIKREFPQHMQGIENIYRENRSSGNTVYSYREDFYKRVNPLLDETGAPAGIPHYVYKGCIPLYDEIYILLCHMQYLYSAGGINTAELDKAVEKYRSWLSAQKAEFNRKKKPGWKVLEEMFIDAADSGEMIHITGNSKLAAFIKDVAVNRKTFDYLKLKLV